MRFTEAAAMLNDLSTQDGPAALRRRLHRYIKPALLVIDEIGYLTYNDRSADLLFQVLNARYTRSSTIVTTNRAFADWSAIFPNATCVVTLVDRLCHHAEIIAIEGESYRLKESRERTASRSKGRKPPPTRGLRGFAVCGDFSQGFVRTACRRCGDELRVPFPCKGRGFCPSCMGRRMAEGAALLVDHVLPPVAILARVHDAILAQDPDAELDLDPALATCVQQSLRGPRLAAAAPDTEPPPGTVSAFGMHLHAATTVDGRDRKRLERVCRYLLRPPFAHDAVEALADGRVRVHFKAPSRRGAAFADMTPDDLGGPSPPRRGAL